MSSPADTIAALVAELDGIEADLVSSSASSSASVQANVESWRANAGYWRELAGKAADGGPAFDLWRNVGVRMADQAQSLAVDVRDDSLSARLVAFAARMPRSLAVVVNATAEAAGEVASTVGTAAVGGLARPVLLAAGVLAIVAFMLSRAGVNVHAGPVGLG